jgi:hypothetical protein
MDDDLQMEDAQFENAGSQVTAASTLKERLIEELRELARQNSEIAAQLRTIRQIQKSLAHGLDPNPASTSACAHLMRACRIALLESDKPQTLQQIHARIEHRASFYFTAPEKAASMIGRTLAEMAARGETQCNAGSWERSLPAVWR